jgi:hypothetical protein
MTGLRFKLLNSSVFMMTLLFTLTAVPTAEAQDLVVTLAQEVRTSVFVGDSLRLRRTIANQDNGTAGTFDVEILLSDDITLGGDVSLATLTIANIPGNMQDGPDNVTVTIPAGTMPGMYFILFNADSGLAVMENNEGNNLGVSGAINVVARNGDLNLSGAVDVADITEVINEALTISMLSGNADFNNDGMVNINDIVASVNIVLNSPPTANPDTLNTNEETALQLNFPGLMVNDQDANSATLRVTNADMISNNGVPVSVLFNGSVTYDPATFPNVQSLPVGSSALDTFTYTITDDQGGFTTATTTVVIAGVNDAPVANNDSFMTAYANTLFGVSQVAPVIVAGSVLANDTDIDNGDVLTVTGAMNTNGATVNMQSNGTFTYLPAVNAVGVQTFDYSISDGNGGTATARVTITIFNQRIFYVDADAPAGGDGRNTSPFNSLSSAAAAANMNNDIIYVFDDNVAGTTRGTITLLDGQQLLGNVNLVVNNTTIFTANGTPTLSNAGPIITVAVNNTVRGFNINPPTGAAITTSAGQARLGTLRINTASIAAAGGSGFVCVPTNANGNTLAVSFSSLSSTAMAAPGLAISNCDGSFSATTGAINTTGARSIDIQGGTANINFGGTILNNTTDNPIRISGTNGGSVTLGGSVSLNDSATQAINIINNSGTVTVLGTIGITDGSVDIQNNTNPVTIGNININNVSTNRNGINLTGNSGVVVINNGTINSGSGIAFLAIMSQLNVTLTRVDVDGFTPQGPFDVPLGLGGTTGSFSIIGDVANTPGSGGTITNVTDINGRTPAIALNNATNVSLEDMILGNPAAVANNIAEQNNNISGPGIISNGVNNLTLTRCLISETGASGIEGGAGNVNLNISDCRFIDCGDEVTEDVIDYEDRNNTNGDQLTGVATLTNCTVADSFGAALAVENFGAGTLNLTLNNVTISVAQNDGVATLVDGAGALNVSVNNCTISNITGSALIFEVDSGSGTYTVTAADIDGTSDAAVSLFNDGGTATLNVTGTAAATFTNVDTGIEVSTTASTVRTNLNFRDITVSSLSNGIDFSVLGGAFNCIMDNQFIPANTITSTANAFSVDANGGANDVSPRIQISNSSFTTSNATLPAGVFQIRNGASNASIFHMTMAGSSFIANGVGCRFRMADRSVFCANLTNNTFNSLNNAGDLDLDEANNNGDMFLLQGFTGDGTDPVVVRDFLTMTQNNTFTNNNLIFSNGVNIAPGVCLLPPSP